jgi:hypothetical protein
MILDPDSMEEVEAAIGTMTEADASPLFIVNGEIVQDISNINAADIESVRVIRGSYVKEFRLRNIMDPTFDRFPGSDETFITEPGQVAEGRRMIIRGADAEGQEGEGIRMIIRGEDSEPGRASEGRRMIINPDVEPPYGQPAMLRNTSRTLLDGELSEKIYGHPKASNGIVIITLKADDGDTSGLEK